MIISLIDAGMDVARLNFSHGTHEDHARRIATLREAARAHERPLAILQDLQGPKIRTGELTHGGPVQLHAAAAHHHARDQAQPRVSTTYTAPHDVKLRRSHPAPDG
jgi:pyruvate kinase